MERICQRENGFVRQAVEKASIRRACSAMPRGLFPPWESTGVNSRGVFGRGSHPGRLIPASRAPDGVRVLPRHE